MVKLRNKDKITVVDPDDHVHPAIITHVGSRYLTFDWMCDGAVCQGKTHGVASFSDENITWARGHIPIGGEEEAALRAAVALTGRRAPVLPT